MQLATRIATQPLHYRSGEEERAAWSLFLLFEKTRQLLEAHREAAEFRAVAVSLLNDTWDRLGDVWLVPPAPTPTQNAPRAIAAT